MHPGWWLGLLLWVTSLLWKLLQSRLAPCQPEGKTHKRGSGHLRRRYSVGVNEVCVLRGRCQISQQFSFFEWSWYLQPKTYHHYWQQMTRFLQMSCCEQELNPLMHLGAWNPRQKAHRPDMRALYEVWGSAVTWETFVEDLHSKRDFLFS